MNYSYLLIDLLTFFTPFFSIAFLAKKIIIPHKKILVSSFIVSIPFLIWDIAFTRAGIWGFDPFYTIGLKIFDLPVEEILFFYCIPYAGLLSYCAVKHVYSSQNLTNFTYYFTIVLALFLLVVSLINTTIYYTFISLFSLSIFLLFKAFFFVKEYDHIAILTYFLLFIPFVIVNGFLTGTFTESPVVWYSPQHILNIRILTIPIEDFFYGMLLILANINVFEYLRAKS